jgi:hypothetical protein
MMTRPQLLLLKLAEEAAEVSQIALKAAQFGLDDVWEKVAPLTVRDRIHGELNDLLGIVAMLNDEAALGFLADPDKVAAKVEKVNRYAALSASLGHVSGPDPSPVLRDPDGPQVPVSWLCPMDGCPETHTHAEHLVARLDLPCPNCRGPLLCDFLPVPF